MFKNKRVIAVLTVMLMAVTMLPSIVFAAGGDGSGGGLVINGNTEVAVDEETALEASFDGDYHVHWTVTGQTNKFEASVNNKGTKLTLKPTAADKKVTVTAQRYKGTTCTNYLCGETMTCSNNAETKGNPKSITITSVEATGEQEQFNKANIKINGELIEEDTEFEIDRWTETEALTASVDGKEYTFKWTRPAGTSDIEVINFIDADGEEYINTVPDMDSNDQTKKYLDSNPIKLKGNLPGTTKVQVVAYNKKGEEQGSAVFSIKVKKTNKVYGPQPGGTDGEPQSIEIIKIKEKYVTEDDITPGEATADAFNNTINTPFVEGEDIELTFLCGAQASPKNYEEEKVREYGLSKIAVYSGNNQLINGKDFEFLGQNKDRSFTVKIKGDKLAAGNYTLAFGSDFALKENGKTLGKNINFAFTVEAINSGGEGEAIPEPGPGTIEDNENDEKPNDENLNYGNVDIITDNQTQEEELTDQIQEGDAADQTEGKELADSDVDSATNTGDDTNVMALFAIMMVAAIAAIGVARARRQN